MKVNRAKQKVDVTEGKMKARFIKNKITPKSYFLKKSKKRFRETLRRNRIWNLRLKTFKSELKQSFKNLFFGEKIF